MPRLIAYDWGVYRHVFLIGPLAIKIGKRRHGGICYSGRVANLIERNRSRVPHLPVAPVYCSLLWGWVLIARRAEPCPAEGLAFQLLATWERLLTHLVPVEPKTSSFGVLDGVVVAVDYGDRAMDHVDLVRERRLLLERHGWIGY